MLPAAGAAAEVDGSTDPAAIRVEEWPALASASARRIAEFAAGRACARHALQQLGLPASTPLPAGSGRWPQWPPGIVGSITHTGHRAAALVARTGVCVAIGLDIERIDAVTPELWPMLGTPRESAWLQAQPPGRQARAAALLFSAKEAWFKCQFPLLGDWLEFGDVELGAVAFGRFTIEPGSAAQRARVSSLRCEGRYTFADGMVRCAVSLLQK